MNRSCLTQSFIYSRLQEEQGLLSPATEKSSYLGRSRCSVKTIDLSDARYLGLVATDALGSVRTMDDISIFHSPPDSEIMLVKRPNNNRQHQLLTDTVKCATTESSRSNAPVSDEVCTSPACEAGTGQYAWADQANRANIQGESFAAVESNKAKVRGTPYAELRKSPEKYQTTDNGQKSKVSYHKPGRKVKGRTKLSPQKRKLNKARRQAKYYASVKGRLAQCIASAKHNAFKTALRRGLSEEAAREKSEMFAKEKRAQLTKELPTSSIA